MIREIIYELVVPWKRNISLRNMERLISQKMEELHSPPLSPEIFKAFSSVLLFRLGERKSRSIPPPPPPPAGGAPDQMRTSGVVVVVVVAAQTDAAGPREEGLIDGSSCPRGDARRQTAGHL